MSTSITRSVSAGRGGGGGFVELKSAGHRESLGGISEGEESDDEPT